jgi:hypothetical protein
MADDLQGNLQNYKLQLQQVKEDQTGYVLGKVCATSTSACCKMLHIYVKKSKAVPYMEALGGEEV